MVARSRNTIPISRVLRRMHRRARWFVVLAVVAYSAGACASADPYRGLTAEQMYQRGQQEYANHDYDGAVKTLNRLLASFAASDVLPDARLLLADANYGKGDYLTAQAEYDRFLDRYPGTAKAPVAALGGCRCLVALSPVPQRDQTYTQDALSRCQNVVVDYPGTPESKAAADLAGQMRSKLADAEYQHADYYFRRKLYDSAIKYYQFVDSLYSETKYAPMALMGIYKANKAIGYDDLADEARKKLLDKYPDSPEAKSVAADGGS
jgi:outer membrane protein assembly factor BamD